MASAPVTNLDKARDAWGSGMPDWIRLLAEECDRSSQRGAGERLRKSSGYVSRLINRSYTGSYPEAEKQIRAAFSAEQVECPIFGPIALKTCIRSRRRSGTPVNFMHHQFAARCPSCSNNTDKGAQ